jgi:hypothetical protein
VLDAYETIAYAERLTRRGRGEPVHEAVERHSTRAQLAKEKAERKARKDALNAAFLSKVNSPKEKE